MGKEGQRGVEEASYREADREPDAAAHLPALEPLLRRIAVAAGQDVGQEMAEELCHLEDEALRAALFPVTRRYAYLNHASVSAPPFPVTRAIGRFLEEAGAHGSATYDGGATVERGVRVRFARLIGARPDAIALTKSVSDSLLTVAGSLPWEAGDNIVTTELEFPSNVYPWLNLRVRGVEVRRVPARRGRVSRAAIAAQLDERTRLVALSFVTFGTGQRNDLAAIAGLAHAAGALICVDAIQGVGALRLDVTASALDFVAVASPKWLLGPSYAGLLYVCPAALERLRALPRGWTSVADPEDLRAFAQPLRAGASRLESGSSDLTALVGLRAALGLLAAAGMGQVERRVLGLAALVRDGLGARGHEILSPDDPGERSGIVCFRPPARRAIARGAALPGEAVTAALAARGVIVSSRDGAVRVSPHFYNTPDDIDRFFTALDTTLA